MAPALMLLKGVSKLDAKQKHLGYKKGKANQKQQLSDKTIATCD